MSYSQNILKDLLSTPFWLSRKSITFALESFQKFDLKIISQNSIFDSIWIPERLEIKSSLICIDFESDYWSLRFFNRFNWRIGRCDGNFATFTHDKRLDFL